MENIEELKPLDIKPSAPEVDVRVKVYRDEDGVLKIDCSRPIPELKLVVAYLSKSQQRDTKRHIDFGRDVLGAISRSTIPYQDWANAIGEAIIQKDADANGGSFEVNALREPAYLALGDTLFRLSPVELVKTNKALAVTKKRASEKADAVIKKKLSDGQLAADTLIETAARLKKQAEDILREASEQNPPPMWAVRNGVAMRYNYDQWLLELPISFSIGHFEIDFRDASSRTKTYKWDAIPQDPTPVRLWVPVNTDGSYSITSIRVDRYDSQMPHISGHGACMSLGDAPKLIRSTDDLSRLRRSIERCMTGVKIDSLLTHLDWLPKFKDSVPPELLKCFKSHNDYKNKVYNLAKSLDAATPVPVEDEGVTTWTA